MERIRTSLPLLILLNKCDQEIEQKDNLANQEIASSSKESSLLTNDSSYSALNFEDVDKLRQLVLRRLGSCLENSELALISISALTNLNVNKSANWILDSLLS